LTTLLLSLSSQGKDIEGIIIYKNDTARVRLKIPTTILPTEPNFLELQRCIKYYDSTGKKKKIRPYEAEEVQFEFNGSLIRMVSVKMNRKTSISSPIDSVMFLHLEVDGYVKLFTFYLATMSKANSTRNLIKKGDSEIIWVYAFTQKQINEVLSDYLSDCIPAVELINKSNAFKFDIYTIVETYNNSCRKD